MERIMYIWSVQNKRSSKSAVQNMHSPMIIHGVYFMVMVFVSW